MNKPINIAADEKATEAVMYLSQYCADHPDCKQCFLKFSNVCVLKWTAPKEWKNTLTKLMERRMNHAKEKNQL